MHRKLRISEYDPLLQKLAGTFRSWAVKMLSYAGRLQLLLSVINGTVNFWMTIFILSKGCLKKIESLCSRFLWTENIENRAIAKVAWTTDCLPKMEDGLGLRKFCEYNSVVPEVYLALVLHHQLTLGYVAQTSPSPKCKRKATDSTSWDSILTLRPLAEQFLKCRINDGVDSRFWFDIWTPFRQLIKYLGDSGPRDIRLPLSASVKDATNKTGWTLPQPRSDIAMALHIQLTTVQLPLQQSILDSFHWVVQAKDCKGFSSSETWEAVRPRAEEKVRAKSV